MGDTEAQQPQTKSERKKLQSYRRLTSFWWLYNSIPKQGCTEFFISTIQVFINDLINVLAASKY